MKHEIGDRIGAIQKADEKTVWLYGYGTYQGEQVPPTGVAHELGWKNPKLLLDNGTIVWGQECWWGAEAAVKAQIQGREIVVAESEESV
jgi:hypothetical protein